MSDTETQSQISISSDEQESHGDNMDLFGKTIRNYNIIYELGRGSYSVVWLCYNIFDNDFYAIKVQNPENYEEAKSETKILKRLPKNQNLIEIQDYFPYYNENKEKYYCMVYNLYGGNLKDIIRNDKYEDGFEDPIIDIIYKQLVNGIKQIHKRDIVHCDLKTENILVKGINKRDEFLIDKYKEANFLEKYAAMKKKYCEKHNWSLKKLKKIKKTKKQELRSIVHKEIIDQIFSDDLELPSSKNIDDKYIKNPEVVIADFGMACEKNEEYKNDFGTRYYRAPEVILRNGMDKKIDLWALGCIMYELSTGYYLFDPDKDKDFTRDHYHLAEIEQVCGNFSSKIIRKSPRKKEFFNNKNLKLTIELDDKFYPTFNSIKKKFIRNLLEIDPHNRYF